MGIVVQAVHLQLQQPVAMKFLLPEVLGNQELVQRFLREAQAAVRLRSEHVARVIDVGSLETGAPYMVLEYLEGTDLSSFPRSQLTVGGIIDLVLQACEGLAEAHSLGIVHRDIKPANFFITQRADGTRLLKVLDFGISKTLTTTGQLTATRTVMGTPAYMSPEQMRSSRDVDHRSDIWSLGVVLYELLQGVPPFEGDTFSSMVLKVVNDPLPKLTVRLPGGLDDIIYRCLQKDPARRFQNIAGLAHAMSKYAQSEMQAAISVQRTRCIVRTEPPRAAVEPGPAQRSLPSTISGSAGARTMLTRNGRRWPILAAIGTMGALIGVIGVAVVVLSVGRRTDGQLPSARPEDAPSPASARGPGATKPASRPAIATTPISPLPPVTTPAPGPAATTPSAPVSVTTRPEGPPARTRTAPPRLLATPPRMTTESSTKPSTDSAGDIFRRRN
jgi:serine/threonine-protein kinase